jgi:hypothetical protein
VSKVRPILLGYQTLRLDSGPEAAENGQRVLRAFAEREGFTLETVFTEVAYEGRLSALSALLERINRGGIAAVVVASPDDLGRLPRVRQAMRARLEREGHVRVLVAQIMTSSAQPYERTGDPT